MDKNKILVTIGVVIILGLLAWLVFSMDNFGETDTYTSDDFENEEVKVVAIVNGEEITTEDYNALVAQLAAQQGQSPEAFSSQLNEEQQSEIIDSLVSQVLISQAAIEAGINIDDSEVEQRIQDVISQVGGEETFDTLLDAEGLSQSDFRQTIESGLLSQAYLEQELDFESVTVTESEVSSLYEEAVAGQENAPELEDVYAQVENLAIQQKQQDIVGDFVADLRTEANVEIIGLQ